MSNDGAGHPAARAIAPPPDSIDGDVSGARLTPARLDGVPSGPAHPAEASWAMATAPTLLLKPVDGADDDAASTSRIPTVPPTDDAASTSRIPTAPPAGLEEQPWFRSGATVPPPSMRPMGESVAPAPRNPPNPRVLKTVFGVIAGCLLIVALASVKLVYQRLRAPAVPTSSQESGAPVAAMAVPDKTLPPAESTRPDPKPAEPESAAAATAPAAAAQPDDSHAATPARATPSHVRTTTKTTTRRAPTPKKPARGTH